MNSEEEMNQENETMNSLIQDSVKFFFQANNKLKKDYNIQFGFETYKSLLNSNGHSLEEKLDYLNTAELIDLVPFVKVGIIDERAIFLLSSSIDFFEIHKELIKEIFLENGYSRGFIGKIGKSAQVHRFDFFAKID